MKRKKAELIPASQTRQDQWAILKISIAAVHFSYTKLI